MKNLHLKTAAEWENESTYTIMDPDGWRHDDIPAGSFENELISKELFDKRLSESTLMGGIEDVLKMFL